MATTGTRKEWLEARLALLTREKELTRLSDELARERQSLPRVRIDKKYVFDTVDGPRTLDELFDDRSQLLVYHLMFAPDDDAACRGCTFFADHLDGARPHLAAADVTLVCASRAPLAKLQAYGARFGWEFPWVSALENDFHHDFTLFTDEELATGKGYNFGHHDWKDFRPGVDGEMMGLSSFALDDGAVHHTYSTFDRGTDVLNATWQLLDRTPKGRDGFGPGRRDEYPVGVA